MKTKNLLKKKIFKATVVSLITFSTNAVLAQDYYVANNGNDSNPGTLAKPWKTLKKINTFSFATGDDVYLKRGDTFTLNEKVYPKWTGAKNNPAIIGAYGTGARPLLKYAPKAGRYSIHVSGKQHFTIENLSILNQGIALFGKGSKDYVVRNVKIKDSPGPAIFIANSDGYLVEGSETDGGGNGGIDIWGSKIEDGQAKNGIIRNNHTHHSKTNQGIVFHSSGDDGGVGSNHLILNNISHHNEEQGIALDTGTYVLVRGNITYENRGAGVGMGDTHHVMIDQHISKNEGYWTSLINMGQGKGSNTGSLEGQYRTVRRSLLIDATSFGVRIHKGSKNIGVVNNTIVSDTPARLEKYKGSPIIYSGGSNVTVLNNIVMSNNNTRVKNYVAVSGDLASTNTRFDNNIYYRPDFLQEIFSNRSFSDWQNISQQDKHGMYKNPLLTNPLSAHNPTSVPEAKNYKLKNDSPAIDKGAPLTKTVDAGSGINVRVGEAYLFFDGFGLTTGDTILIGSNQPVIVKRVDYANNILTVNKSISWNSGDGVSLPYKGSAPDIGAFESGVTNDSGDTQAPTVPANLKASAITSNSITLNWNASTDNIGVSEYEVHYNDKVKTASSNSITLSGLTPNVNYSIKVRAKDAAGNLSAFSNPETAVTDALPVTPVTVPVALTPKGSISDRTPTYAWKAVSGAKYYYLWSRDSSGKTLFKGVSLTAAKCANGTGTCSFDDSAELAFGAGKWHVIAWINKWGDWSPASNYTVIKGN